VGTSGWSYAEWVGPFYPDPTPPSGFLSYYAARLPAVEAHATFRRVPGAATLEKWCAAVPESFRFAPKAHLGITHRRDLTGVDERVTAFFGALSPLGGRLGPVLFQLPHHTPDLERLDAILAAVPRSPTAAFELAPAWLDDERVLSRLAASDATVVLVDTDRRPAPDLEVGPLAYVRLRRTRYRDGELDEWGERLAKLRAAGRDVYAFVKHDERGLAPSYAARLLDALQEGDR
jgi:uncharacterized protein YecE (DUF72 family)